MRDDRQRVFESALNDVTYLAGRPLRLLEGLEFLRRNADVENRKGKKHG